MKLASINVEHHKNIAIVKLNNGVTNALNLDFIQEISNNIQKLEKDKSIKGLIITSENNKFFSIGFDLPQLNQLNDEGLKLFYHTFNQLSLDLYKIPKPIIAAITGHAIAGGCILAICCDYRFIADERKLMGLNEIKLGLPVPYPSDCILRQLVGPKNAQEIVYTGEFYEPNKSLEMGLVDVVLPMDQVLPKAIEKVKLLCEMSGDAFEIIKNNRVEKVVEMIKNNLEEKQQNFLRCWKLDDTQKLIKEAIKKF